MHLRRAILLFAIVLGLTAIASSVAPPPKDTREDAPPPAVVEARPDPAGATPPPTLAFTQPVAGRPRERPVAKGRHATVSVRSREPGQVSIPRLGLTGEALPGTPASFDVLFSDAGRYDVLFRPVGGEPSRLGTLVVRE